MPKLSYWFKHDCNARNDPKILALRSIYGGEGYGWYWMIVEMLREQSDYRFPINKYTNDIIAFQLQSDSEKVGQYLDACYEIGLFTCDKDTFWSESLVRRMEGWDAQVDAGREAAKKRWGDRKLLATHKQAIGKPKETLEEYKEKLRLEYPELDFDGEVRKWETWWSESKEPLKRPKTALRKWMDKAREFKKNEPVPDTGWRPR